MTNAEKPLTGHIAVVLGATRASGRGIAIELGAAGATVYCTGRSVRGVPHAPVEGAKPDCEPHAPVEGAEPDCEPSANGRSETIDETAERVSAHGGIGIPVKVDHVDEEQVRALFERIAEEQNGRLDILVNVGASGGDPGELESWANGLPFWETNLHGGLSMLRGVGGHIITNRYAIPLMAARNSGLVVEVGDGTSYSYRGVNHGMFYYSLCKINLIHIAEAIAMDFRHRKLDGMTAVALTPGYLRRGEGAEEEQWQEERRAREIEEGLPRLSDGGRETPRYIGRAVVALATDPNVNAKSGKPLSTGGLMKEYGFTDIDGRQPFWDWTAC